MCLTSKWTDGFARLINGMGNMPTIGGRFEDSLMYLMVNNLPLPLTVSGKDGPIGDPCYA